MKLLLLKQDKSNGLINNLVFEGAVYRNEIDQNQLQRTKMYLYKGSR